MSIHENARKKVCDMFKARGIHDGIIVLEGGGDFHIYDSDVDYNFRQDSWFHYLFGVKEPDMYAAIFIKTGKAVLFIPKLPPSYAVIMGEVYPPSHFKDSYAVDEVLYTDDIESWVASTMQQNEGKIHLVHGVNSDSGFNAKTGR